HRDRCDRTSPPILATWTGVCGKPKFDAALQKASLWHPILPPFFGFWPTRFVRSWLRNHLKAQSLKFVSDQEATVSKLFWTQLDQPLREISERVSKYAMQLEGRAIEGAGISSRRRHRVARANGLRPVHSSAQ